MLSGLAVVVWLVFATGATVCSAPMRWSEALAVFHHVPPVPGTTAAEILPADDPSLERLCGVRT